MPEDLRPYSSEDLARDEQEYYRVDQEITAFYQGLCMKARN